MKKIIIVYNSSKYVYLFKKNLIRSLILNNFDITIVAPRDKYTNRLNELGVSYKPISIASKGLNPFVDVIFLMKMIKIYRDIQPNYALLFTIKPNIYGTLASCISNVKVINNITGLGTVFLKDGFIQHITKILYKYSFKFSSTVFFQNSEDMSLFIDQGLIDVKKAILIPGSGVDVDHFKPMKKTPKDKVIFLMIGRVLIDKGIIEYIEAAKIVQTKNIDAEFWLLGGCDSENRSAISQHQVLSWEEAGIIKYLGEVDDVREFISIADVVVLPSYREGMPRVLLEALSMATPIIGSNVPGCREVVNDKVNGYFCEVKNSQDLALQIKKMVFLGAEARKEMGKKGRKEILKKFDEKIVINHYLSLLNTKLN